MKEWLIERFPFLYTILENKEIETYCQLQEECLFLLEQSLRLSQYRPVSFRD